MSDKFGEGRDPYLYPGLDIMRNRLNIHQQQRLEQAAYRNDGASVLRPLSLVRWCAVYRICALSIASCIRIFLTGRGNCVKLIFIRVIRRSATLLYIEKRGNALMQDLEEEGYLVGPEKAKFVERLAHYYCGNQRAASLPGGKWSGTADLLRATGDSCRISTELAGYRKRGPESGKSEWGNGDPHRTADDI